MFRERLKSVLLGTDCMTTGKVEEHFLVNGLEEEVHILIKRKFREYKVGMLIGVERVE